MPNTFPHLLYTDIVNSIKGTKTSITAMTGMLDGAIAYATDTNELGFYSATQNTWTWLGVHMEITIGDGANLDAFSRLRVSQPETLFSSLADYGYTRTVYETGGTGAGVSGTYNSTTRMTLLSVGNATGTSYIQSFEYVPYQPGKSQLIFVTGLLGSGTANVTKDIGYFDANNGIFYRQNGTSGLQIVRRTSTSGVPVDNAVNQANWNLDKLDGTGTSKITLDPTKVFILAIDLQFLAMGRVRVGFDIGGQIIYAHEFLNSNVLTTPYMQMANLPLQGLISANSGVGGASTMYYKCASVSSEGGYSSGLGFPNSTPEGTVTAASGARTHVLSIRPKTTYQGLTNRIKFILENINILVTGNNPVFWELVVGASFSGAPTWADVNTSYSGFEYGIGGTFSSLTGGIVVASGYCAASATSAQAIEAKISSIYPISLDRSGAVRALGTLSLLASGIGNTTATRASFDFVEVR